MTNNYTPMPETTFEFTESCDSFTSNLAPGLALRTDIVYDASAAVNKRPVATSYLLLNGEIVRTYAHGERGDEGDMLHGYVVGVALAAYNIMNAA